MKSHNLFLLFIFCFQWITAYALMDYKSTANPQASITSVDGHARFTVLTDRLLRMEYSETAFSFEDRPTVPFLNRYFADPPAFKLISSDAQSLSFQTQSLRLSYTPGAPFSPENLLVEGLDPSSAFSRWAPNMTNSNSGNLLGTVRSLDLAGVLPLNCTLNENITVHHESLHCAWGLFGLQGFALVDDSASWTLNASNYYFWSELGSDARDANQDLQDWYLFAHGSDYPSALADFVAVAGRIAMPPRFATGVMYTRWYNYDSLSLKHILHAHQSRALPLDVLILDMDWHTKTGWGSYSVDTRLFQVPSDAFAAVRQQGVAMALNLHDDSGVAYTETMYAPFAASQGVDPATRADIPFSIVNSSYVFPLEDIVLGGLEALGANFWWIDWQQGGAAGGISQASGLSQNPTIMLNHVRATDPWRRGSSARAMVLGRWGGLGNHRYQVGFSGDVLGPRSAPEMGLTWRNLAYQPYFTWTAANVGFGFWSHDLVGPHTDHELHTRWLQWGASSPVFRTHDRGMSSGDCALVSQELCAIVRVWDVPLRFFEINRAAMSRRAQWVPYIYAQYRAAYDSGLSILRPMYYAYPQLQLAYAGGPEGQFAQYFFGDAMFIAPVVAPAAKDTQMAAKTVWLPPGQWFELDTGMLFTGGESTLLAKQYDLSEIPTFVRAGAVVPSLVIDETGSFLGIAAQQYAHLRFTIYPGGQQGSASLYEDDGATTAYTSAANTVSTNVTYAYSGNATSSRLDITIQSFGAYPSFPASRLYQVLLPNVFPPSSVVFNQLTALPYSRFGRASPSSPTFWTYLGNEVALLVQLPTVATSQPTTLTLVWSDLPDASALTGIRGAFAHGALAKQNLDEVGLTPGTHSTAGGYLDLLVSTGDALSFLAGTNISQFVSRIQSFQSVLFPRALAEVSALHAYLQGSLLQLYSQDRQDSLLCASAKCVNSDIRYGQIRIEGYLPVANDSATATTLLSVYWNPDAQDHLVTTLPSPPAGYHRTNLPTALVLSKPLDDTSPLSLYYHPLRQDYLTVATDAGRDFAQYWQYQLINASIGYVYNQPPLNTPEYVPANRLSYSLALLMSVFVETN